MTVIRLGSRLQKVLVTGLLACVFVLLASTALAVDPPVFQFPDPYPDSYINPYPIYNEGADDAKNIALPTTLKFGTFGGTPIVWDVSEAQSAEATTQVLISTTVRLPDNFAASKWNESLLRKWLNGVATGQFASSANFTSADYRALVPDTRPFDGSSVNSVDRFFVGGFDSATPYALDATIQVKALVDLRLLEYDAVDSSRVLGTSSPHGGYTSTTNKCASCHSVHSAYTESAVMGGAPSMLLATSVADACTYCHIDANARSDVKIYGGVASNYNGSADSTVVAGAHRSNRVSGVETGVSCSKCHTVHGTSSKMTGNAYLDASLLSKVDSSTVPFENNPADTPEIALSKWCVQCHTFASATKPHMNLSSASSTTTVAWQDVTGCTSCHAAGTETSDFPHYTAGAASFLLSATSAQAVPTGATSATEDGVCLRCHRENDTSGVGVEF